MTETKIKYRQLTATDYVIAGGGSGCLARVLCQPLDVVKIRFQLQVEPIIYHGTSKYKSLVHAISLIVQEEGVKALWKGHMPAQLLSLNYGVCQFSVFEWMTHSAKAITKENRQIVPLVNFTSGSVAGCTATIVSYPFDIVRTRLVAQSENRKVYTGFLNCFLTILRREGLLALFRGLSPTLVQIAPHAGAQFMCYKTFQNLFNSVTKSPYTTLTGSLVAGSLAGLIAKTAVYPFDVAKKRMQIQGFEEGRKLFGKTFSCQGFSDCLVKIYKYEGYKGLFKGLNPSLLKAVLSTALSFSTYEMICQSLQRYSA